MSTSRRSIIRLAKTLQRQRGTITLLHRQFTTKTPLIISSANKRSRRCASTLPPRSADFTTITSDHITQIRSLLSFKSSLISTLDGTATVDDLTPFNNDWMHKYRGKSQVVVKPKSTEEVSKVMRYCYEQGIAIVPQGGNTGLVGESDLRSYVVYI